jgi:uncharacterized protein (TIGR02246 family)
MSLFSRRWLWLPIAFGLVPLCVAQERSEKDRSEESAAVRQAAEAYIAALGRGDAAQLAASWTPEGDFIDSQGQKTKGRELAKRAGIRSRKGIDDQKLTITVDSIRFVTPEVAIEDGTVDSPADADEFSVAHYTAIWVKHDGKWLLDGVRESAPSEGSHRDRLRALSWLVGDWVQQGGEGSMELTCHWSPDGNFLLREIKAESPAGVVMTVSQRIGWDAAKKQITAWTFDSDGGHGVGVWSLQGDRWVVKSTGALSDGQTATLTSTYTRNGVAGFVWETTQSGEDVGSSLAHRRIELVRRKSADKPHAQP